MLGAIDSASNPIAPNNNKFREFHKAIIELAAQGAWKSRSSPFAPQAHVRRYRTSATTRAASVVAEI
jgi:hypothetical protein